jgi:broad specificity phosphatase PhoE
MFHLILASVQKYKINGNRNASMSQLIYLIRHGQTDFNKNGIVQGSSVDTDLNDTGRAQAQAFFEHHKEIGFGKVYTSALKRAQQSVASFITAGIPHTILDGFNEMSWGIMDGKPVEDGKRSFYKEMVGEWNSGNEDFKIEGGESPKEVGVRVVNAMDIVEKEDLSPILICMHGRAMRILLCKLMGKPLSEMDAFVHNNLSLYVLERKEKQYKVLRHNELSHLKGLR